MKLNINEIFGPTIQGEGLFTGRPSVFCRLNGCNLRCAFAGGSVCDTGYTSWNMEKRQPKETSKVADDIMKIFKQYPNVNQLVITGGEPLLQAKPLLELLQTLHVRKDDIEVTIETNGSIMPPDEMFYEVSLWSLSPKLRNSEHFEGIGISKVLQEQHKKLRFNQKALLEYISQANLFQLKFVGSDERVEQDVDEFMKDLYKGLDENTIEYTKQYISWRGWIMLMPAGQTLEQINESTEKILPICYKRGWNYCDRLHIRLWGDKRGV